MLKGWAQVRGHGWEEMGHSEKATPHVSILRLATTGLAGRVIRVGEEVKWSNGAPEPNPETDTWSFRNEKAAANRSGYLAAAKFLRPVSTKNIIAYRT